VLEDDEKVQWNPALEDIREEPHPEENRRAHLDSWHTSCNTPKTPLLTTITKCVSRSRSNSELPQTPDGEHVVQDTLEGSPRLPEPKESAIPNPARPATTAGIIAGSIAEGGHH